MRTRLLLHATTSSAWISPVVMPLFKTLIALRRYPTSLPRISHSDVKLSVYWQLFRKAQQMAAERPHQLTANPESLSWKRRFSLLTDLPLRDDLAHSLTPINTIELLSRPTHFSPEAVCWRKRNFALPFQLRAIMHRPAGIPDRTLAGRTSHLTHPSCSAATVNTFSLSAIEKSGCDRKIGHTGPPLSYRILWPVKRLTSFCLSLKKRLEGTAAPSSMGRHHFRILPNDEDSGASHIFEQILRMRPGTRHQDESERAQLTWCRRLVVHTPPPFAPLFDRLLRRALTHDVLVQKIPRA